MPRRDEWEDDDQDLRPRRKKAKKPSALWFWVPLALSTLVIIGVIVGAVLLLPHLRGVSGIVPSAAIDRIRVTPGLVAYWSFEDAQQNGAAPDHSGRNNNASLRGGRLAPGPSGQALWLDGVPEQYCDLGSSPDLNFPANGGFTFAGWFRTDEPSATILSLRSDRNNSQIDLLIRQGKLLIVVGDDTDPGPLNAFVFARQPNDGQWHHFAFTRNGGTIELFLDGMSQGTNQALHSGGPITPNLRALGSERAWAIANDRRWGNASFRGGIDEVCVFNRPLTQAEILVLVGR